MACPCKFAKRARPRGSDRRHAAESTDVEERLVLVVLDELDRLVVDGMVGITSVQFDLFAVAEKVGVVGVHAIGCSSHAKRSDPCRSGCSVIPWLPNPHFQKPPVA